MNELLAFIDANSPTLERLANGDAALSICDSLWHAALRFQATLAPRPPIALGPIQERIDRLAKRKPRVKPNLNVQQNLATTRLLLNDSIKAQSAATAKEEK